MNSQKTLFDNAESSKEDKFPNELPKDWKWITVENCLDKKAKFRLGKLKSKDYLENGDYPIIDQGKKFVIGYYNDETLLYDGKLPVVLMGDHTLNLKYVNFNFIQGADGLKVLIPKEGILAKYLYYMLEFAKPEVEKYSRHYKIVKNLYIPIPYKENHPDIEKQQKIIVKLDMLNKKLNELFRLQRLQIMKISELRDSILNKAFKGQL